MNETICSQARLPEDNLSRIIESQVGRLPCGTCSIRQGEEKVWLYQIFLQESFALHWTAGTPATFSTSVRFCNPGSGHEKANVENKETSADQAAVSRR